MGLIHTIGNALVNLIEAVYGLLWGDIVTLPLPGGGTLGLSILVIILVPAGVYFTIRTRFMPFRMLPEMLRVTMEKRTGPDHQALSGVQALVVSTATRVGMGNLVGVVAAISAGAQAPCSGCGLSPCLAPPLPLRRRRWRSCTSRRIPSTEDTGAARPTISMISLSRGGGAGKRNP